MKKNIALMALTGILTLASCSQTPGGDTTPPTVTLGANPATVTGAGTSVLSGVASDSGSGVKSVTVTGSTGAPACTAVLQASGAFSCTITTTNPTATTTYTYTAIATDNAGNNSAPATASVTVNPQGTNPNPGTVNHTVTVNLTGVSGTNITVKDANGAIVAGYNNGPITSGSTITLPAGKYTIYPAAINGYTGPTPASATVDLTSADGTVSFAYVASTNPTNTGAYYIDGSGKRVYFNFGADGYDPSKFRFNAWLEDETGGINPAGINAGTGNAGIASDPEKLEYAPFNHQNILGSYMEYNDNGTWRPVVGAQVEMNIQPEAQNVIPAIRFTAADDVNRTTAPITGQDIHSNGFSSRSWTNSTGAYETNPIWYPNDATYPYYNVTGVGNPIVPGYSWAALMNDPITAWSDVNSEAQGYGYLQARVQVVGFVNGNEVGKQFVTKRFIPQAKVDIKKELLLIDPVTRLCTVPLDKTATGANPVYLPGEEACLRITIRNTGEAVAKSIKFTESWTPTKLATYSIGMTPTEYTRLTTAGNGQVVFDGTPTTLPTLPGQDPQTTPTVKFVDEKFSGTVVSLAPQTQQTITFFGRGINNGTYCDNATLGNYLNNPDPITGAYRLVPNYGQKTDQACFKVFGQPDLNITKTITYDDNNPVDPGFTANRNQWVTVKVTVRNDGTQVAENINVQDRLNADANAAAHSVSIDAPALGMTTPTAAQGDDGMDWTIPKLQAGQLITYTYRARANVDGSYCDTASIVSVAGTAVTDKNSSACFVVAMAELTIAKTNTPSDGLLPGDYYTSNIVVRNISTSSAYEVNVFDFIGQGQRTGAQVVFVPNPDGSGVNGRYIITTDQGLPLGTQPRGVATYFDVINTGDNRSPNPATAPLSPVVVDPTQAPYTNSTLPAPGVVTTPSPTNVQYGVGQTAPGTDGLPHGVVIPAGGSLTLTVVSQIPRTLDDLTVVSQIPRGAPIDNYCDVAVVTANNSNLVSAINRARACTTIKHILAVQTTLDDLNDPIAKGSSTLFTGSFYNEAQSTEGAVNDKMVFTVPTGANDATATLNVSNIRVYFDPTAEVDGSGQIVFNPASPGFVEITGSSTVSGITNGQFTVQPNLTIPVNGVVFVTYNGSATATTPAQSYNSNVVWTSNGEFSGMAKTDTAAEDTSVR